MKGTGSIIKHIHKQFKEYYQNLFLFYFQLHNVIKFNTLFVDIFILGHLCEGKVNRWTFRCYKLDVISIFLLSLFIFGASLDRRPGNVLYFPTPQTNWFQLIGNRLTPAQHKKRGREMICVTGRKNNHHHSICLGQTWRPKSNKWLLTLTLLKSNECYQTNISLSCSSFITLYCTSY